VGRIQATDGNIEIQGGDFERVETYLGGGANLEFDVTDRLTVTADFGYSSTERTEDNREFRIQSDRSPVIVFDRTDGIVPEYSLFDTSYDLGGGFFKELQAGVRWAQQDYLELPGGAESGNPLDIDRGRFSFEIENDGELTVNNREVLDDSNESSSAAAFDQQRALEASLVSIIGTTRDACYNEFVEDDFLSSTRNGDLVTVFDDDGNATGTNSWAQFDAGCIAETAVGSLNSILNDINAYLTNPDARENSFGNALAGFSADRADPADMGFSRRINNAIDDDETVTSIDQLIGTVVADGNPELDPLMSWNYDASFEYYPNPDTILAIGAYYKQFQGGFENVRQNETFQVNGQDITRAVSVSQTSDDNSTLFGIELTASHGFTYLPGLLSGLGVKLSYNYVDSNFEFEDSRYGDGFQRQLDGSVIQTNEGIIAPAGLPGLSENTVSAQVYYGIGDLDLQVNYKYRDDYFQPFIADGTRLRYVGDVGVWEARAAYKLTDNFRLTAEAINLFSEPKEQFAFVQDDLYEVNDYGPRVFFGIRGRF